MIVMEKNTRTNVMWLSMVLLAILPSFTNAFPWSRGPDHVPSDSSPDVHVTNFSVTVDPTNTVFYYRSSVSITCTASARISPRQPLNIKFNRLIMGSVNPLGSNSRTFSIRNIPVDPESSTSDPDRVTVSKVLTLDMKSWGIMLNGSNTFQCVAELPTQAEGPTREAIFTVTAIRRRGTVLT